MTQNGIHHVTAIAGEARRNLHFYSRVLGLRLVKKTVNFDDPSAYHLYYGDAAGSPGTILTFFPWEHAAKGRAGSGELQETVFRIPQGAIGYWTHRLMEQGLERAESFGQTVLRFQDPDGMRLALVGLAGIEAEPAWDNEAEPAWDNEAEPGWSIEAEPGWDNKAEPGRDKGGVPVEFAIRGIQGVTLLVRDAVPTGAILSDVFGFAEAAREGGTTRFQAAGTTLGGIVDLRLAGGALPARLGRGSVHHLAFRAADDAAQAAMVRRLAEMHGLHSTEQKDRDYFRSVYFREPGQVLFEIATDAPGFAVDEPVAALGQALKLPRFLQGHRAEIEAALPAID